MKEDNSLPPPINFNCWKHHTGLIKQQIALVKTGEDVEEISKHLLRIGESQMDLYFGKFSPSNISKQIISHLKKVKNFYYDKYVGWLRNDGDDYKLIHLSDKSIWTLRQSENQERYVHIHPGRYSPHTIRVKATTLKTAIVILCYMQADEVKSIETEMVNFIRKKYLNEPPIKSFSGASGLRRLAELLRI
jgi:hypothetical protein